MNPNCRTLRPMTITRASSARPWPSFDLAGMHFLMLDNVYVEKREVRSKKTTRKLQIDWIRKTSHQSPKSRNWWFALRYRHPPAHEQGVG